MERLDNNKFQYRLLRAAYKIAPFNFKGEWVEKVSEIRKNYVSCLIIASSRPNELDALLEDLSLQDLGVENFEVCVLNDGAGVSVRQVVEKYQKHLNIIYQENQQPHRILSNLRNTTLAMANGEYILLLDDDTRIMQNNFLTLAGQLLERKRADVLMPRAYSFYGIVKAKYDFLDEYSMTNRCCLYRREVLEQLGGFKKDLNTYEDIELSIRVMIKQCMVFKVNDLEYLHPPLYFDSMRKPLSIGQTIFQIKRQYSFLVWLIVYLNALRFLPYGLIPNKICQQWFKISLGVLLYPFYRKSYYY